MGIGRVNWSFGHADSFLGLDLGSSRLISCSTVPQNLTSGRHTERLTPKSLILEVNGLGRMGPIFMAARTLGGPPTKIRRGVAFVDAVMTLGSHPSYAAFNTAPSGTSPWVT